MWLTANGARRPAARYSTRATAAALDAMCAGGGMASAFVVEIVCGVLTLFGREALPAVEPDRRTAPIDLGPPGRQRVGAGRRQRRPVAAVDVGITTRRRSRRAVASSLRQRAPAQRARRGGPHRSAPRVLRWTGAGARWHRARARSCRCQSRRAAPYHHSRTDESSAERPTDSAVATFCYHAATTPPRTTAT